MFSWFTKLFKRKKKEDPVKDYCFEQFLKDSGKKKWISARCMFEYYRRFLFPKNGKHEGDSDGANILDEHRQLDEKKKMEILLFL